MVLVCLLCNLVVVVYVSMAAADVLSHSEPGLCADGAFSCFQVLGVPALHSLHHNKFPCTAWPDFEHGSTALVFQNY